MKKIILGLIILCIILAACDATDSDNLFGTTQGSLSTNSSIATGENDYLAESIDGGYYQYGNMQKNLPSGNYILYDGEVLFTKITNGEGLLYAYDLATGEVSLFCKDATCSHRDQTCSSKIAYGNLEQYNGKLYAKSLEQISVDMPAVSRILELNNGQFEPMIDGTVAGFWHANGNLYVETADMSLLVYEKGSDTPQILLDEYAERWNTVFGHYLYSGYGKICRVDLSAEQPELEVLIKDCYGITDGEHFYYMDMEDMLYRCDMDGSDSKLLVDDPVIGLSVNFDDEYLYFRLYGDGDAMYGNGCGALYRMSKNDPQKIEIIAELPEAINTVYTVPGQGLLFIETRSQQPDEDGNPLQGPIFVVRTDGSDPQLLELPDF